MSATDAHSGEDDDDAMTDLQTENTTDEDDDAPANANTGTRINTPTITEFSSKPSTIIAGGGKVESEAFIPNSNIVTHCIYTNDLERLTNCFDNQSDANRKEAIDNLNKRDSVGKSPLDIAACLGREEIVGLLVERGGEINKTNSKGYTCLHYAAAWGRKNVLKILCDNGGDLQIRTIHNERPRDIAIRYNQEECVNFLDWAEAKNLLQDSIIEAQELMNEPTDKNAITKLTREDKFILLNTCKEKQDWLINNLEATTQEFITQRTSFINIVTPILNKITDSRKNSHMRSEFSSVASSLHLK
ncbi:ankyrin repeat domain-containing protein 45-like isoform X2 [Physella acuta]|uniref:ankyrin repeat domain-containing protein 45-like isoform X2 n=1 Tax=Physella acuta TaxID=109671 RepID=UPI0027DD8641|nr:ankyrin repeat domain-containing protein 45-like isoform X2 [Physella acuta]